MLGKFKAGDVVRIIRDWVKWQGHLGIVRDIYVDPDDEEKLMYIVQVLSDPDNRKYYYASSLEKANEAQVQSG